MIASAGMEGDGKPLSPGAATQVAVFTRRLVRAPLEVMGPSAGGLSGALPEGLRMIWTSAKAD